MFYKNINILVNFFNLLILYTTINVYSSEKQDKDYPDSDNIFMFDEEIEPFIKSFPQIAKIKMQDLQINENINKENLKKDIYNNEIEIKYNIAKMKQAYFKCLINSLCVKDICTQIGYKSDSTNQLNSFILIEELTKKLDLPKCEKEYLKALEYYDTDNNELAFVHFILASQDNHPYALFYLGNMYSDGIFLQEDKLKAFEYYNKSANLNVPEAMYNVAIYYYNGIGSAKNINKAIHWLEKIAKSKTDLASQAIKTLKLIYSESQNADSSESDS